MNENILYAKPLVEKEILELRNRVEKLNHKPRLVIIKVGKDKASDRYVQNKIKRCAEVGVISEIVEFTETVSQREVELEVLRRSCCNNVTAILLQLPIPKHLNVDEIMLEMESNKDVDGFTIENVGAMVLEQEGNVPCTARGVIDLLKFYNIEIEGKDVVIVNRSNIVGKPLMNMFLNEDATITVCHSKTTNLREKVKAADIVISAIGKADFFDVDSFKEGSVIVDVAINFDSEGKMCGDVKKSDYEKLVNKGCKITPVPNGIGQMTTLELIKQTVEIAERECI